MNPRFFSEVDAINQKVTGFNQHLNPTIQVPLLNVNRMIEDKSCVQIVHQNWYGFNFPNGGKRGVYFLFGREKLNPEKNGLYIGKASFSSCMGARLYQHLTHHRNNEWFEMNGYHNEKYILDYIATIDLDSLNLAFLASALEEYLITELKGAVNLINGTGN